MSTTSRPLKFISGLLSDNGLTKKAYLNALTVVLDYGASLIVGFIVTPLLVAGLGNYPFGMWQVLIRLIGYITPASGRPGFALKATLANQQASTDYAQKRRYVGSTLLIWLMFLPLLVGVGAIVTWYIPAWVHAPASLVWIVRIVAAILVADLVFDALSSVPQVTLQGENLGYKRMGMSVVLVLMGGGFTWIALYFKNRPPRRLPLRSPPQPSQPVCFTCGLYAVTRPGSAWKNPDVKIPARCWVSAGGSWVGTW